MMEAHLSGTREHVEEERHYLYWDMACDRYLAGEYDLDEAVKRYNRLLGGFALDSSAQDTEADLF